MHCPGLEFRFIPKLQNTKRITGTNFILLIQYQRLIVIASKSISINLFISSDE